MHTSTVYVDHFNYDIFLNNVLCQLVYCWETHSNDLDLVSIHDNPIAQDAIHIFNDMKWHLLVICERIEACDKIGGNCICPDLSTDLGLDTIDVYQVVSDMITMVIHLERLSSTSQQPRDKIYHLFMMYKNAAEMRMRGYMVSVPSVREEALPLMA
jgi:hypothetical protein